MGFLARQLDVYVCVLRNESIQLQGSVHSEGGRGGKVKSAAFDEMLTTVGGIMQQCKQCQYFHYFYILLTYIYI